MFRPAQRLVNFPPISADRPLYIAELPAVDEYGNLARQQHRLAKTARWFSAFYLLLNTRFYRGRPICRPKISAAMNWPGRSKSHAPAKFRAAAFC